MASDAAVAVQETPYSILMLKALIFCVWICIRTVMQLTTLAIFGTVIVGMLYESLTVRRFLTGSVLWKALKYMNIGPWLQLHQAWALALATLVPHFFPIFPEPTPVGFWAIFLHYMESLWLAIIIRFPYGRRITFF